MLNSNQSKECKGAVGFLLIIFDVIMWFLLGFKKGVYINSKN